MVLDDVIDVRVHRRHFALAVLFRADDFNLRARHIGHVAHHLSQRHKVRLTMLAVENHLVPAHNVIVLDPFIVDLAVCVEILMRHGDVREVFEFQERKLQVLLKQFHHVLDRSIFILSGKILEIQKLN